MMPANDARPGNTPLFDDEDAKNDRVLPIAQQFLQRLENGEQPQIEDYLKKYPDLEGPLRTCLEGVRLLSRGCWRSLRAAFRGGNSSRAFATFVGGLSNCSRNRAWWHGHRLRSRPIVARPQSRSEGASLYRDLAAQAVATVSERGASRGSIAPP